MAGIGEFLGVSNLGGIFGTIASVSMTVVIAFVVIAIIGGGAYWYWYNKKRWFLTVEVKIPRSDGKLLNAEIAKGSYDSKKGVVLIKRRGMKACAVKPFDIKRYLQGGTILTVVQVGIKDYIPVMLDSYLEMEDTETGEAAAMMKIKIDTSESQAWKTAFERDAKNTYSIMGLLQQHMPIIAIGLVIFLWGIQFLILYNRISS